MREREHINTENNTETSLADFLSAFYPDENEAIHLRAFSVPGVNEIEPNTYKVTRNLLQTDTERILSPLSEHNIDRGIYFVVNAGGNKDKDITRYNAFFAENDDLSIQEQHEALDNALIQPSIRIETQKSVHAHWLIEGECSEEDWRDIQERLINYFNADTKNKNPSRCMRLPFFNHVSLNEETGKYQHKRVELITFQPESRFTVEEMKEAFPLPEISDKTCDERDDCDDSNPTYENWEELNAELGKRIMQGGKLNGRGKYEMQCPVHRGKTETSLFFDPNRNTMKCLALCSHTDLLQAFGLPTKPAKQGEAEDEVKESKKSQASLLFAFAEEVELFTSQNDEAYATVPVNNHFETWAVQSKAFGNWLAKRFYQIHGKPPAKNSLEEAQGMFEGEAMFGNDIERKEVFTRIAELDGTIYLDLVDDDWRVIKITCDGWEVVSDYPVKFRRAKGMKPLPIPESNGSLNDLDEFLNIQGDSLKLVKGWLLACLKPNIDYPVLVLQGEQGCAKSTACEVLCELVDPNGENLKTAPKDERDLAISATNRLVVCFDNLSGIKTWLSDTLCRISTGGGFSTRKLHTDNEEMIFNLHNPILLNGIDEIATRSDLLDRSIIIYLQTIESRKPKQEFWNEFEMAKPRILGALLDTFCEALRNIDDVIFEDYPRMADFTKLATAAEKALGLEANEFVEIYNKNRNEANKLVIEISYLSSIIFDLVSDKEEWVGIAKDIKDRLDEKSDPITQRSPYYPKSFLKVANDLRRLAPNLRQEGIDVHFDWDEKQREAGTGNRLIRIRNLNFESSQSSQSSQREEQAALYI